MESIRMKNIRMESVKIKSIRMKCIPMESIKIKSIPMKSIRMENIRMESIRMKSIRMERIRMNSMRKKSIRMKKRVQMKSIRMEKVYEWKEVCEWKVYEWKVFELKIVQNEKQPSNVFLTKRNGKCTQPNKKVVPSDNKCIWSKVNLGYGNVTIQLWHDCITWANGYNT